MSIPFYADYVNHMMRYYSATYFQSSTRPRKFRTEADRRNWIACDTVLKRYPDNERTILLTLYSESEVFTSDGVIKLADRLHIPPKEIWTLLNEMTRRIAKVRCLI